ncbi:sigma factor-like helix-turn-helix DNA-binding protein [Patescibacteria group bacterium]
MKNSINFSQICDDLLKNLSPRQKEVVERRFGLKSGSGETLEAIGKSHNITRERVRQIERDSFEKMKPKVKKYQNAFNYLVSSVKRYGGLKKEDTLLLELASERNHPKANLLLALHDQFSRIPDNPEFYPLWTTDKNSLKLAKKVNNFITSKLKEQGKAMPFSKVFEFCKKSALSKENNLNSQNVLSFVEVSKKIEQGMNNLFGLKDWPEINPKGIKDRAFLVLQKEQKPIHFTNIASLIPKLPFIENFERRVVPQTVHNELIKDPRFVLVGRGMYALKEWGYEPGVVKDIIKKVMKDKGKPMTKKEIMRETLKQRMVKESTVALNLQNNPTFIKNTEGKYTLRKI